MIEITFFRNSNNEIYGFKAFNHGDTIVCAAVSALTLNTVNAVEAFCNCDFTCDYEESGGFLSFTVKDIKNEKHCHDASLLLNTLELGIKSISEEYEDEVLIKD